MEDLEAKFKAAQAEFDALNVKKSKQDAREEQEALAEAERLADEAAETVQATRKAAKEAAVKAKAAAEKKLKDGAAEADKAKADAAKLKDDDPNKAKLQKVFNDWAAKKKTIDAEITAAKTTLTTAEAEFKAWETKEATRIKAKEADDKKRAEELKKAFDG